MQQLKKIIILTLLLPLIQHIPALAVNTDINRNATYYYTAGHTELNNYKITQDRMKLRYAIYNFKKMYELDNSNIDALIGLSIAYRLDYKPILAKNAILKALNYDYNSPKANFYLGEYYFSQNEFTNALNSYKKAEKLGFKGEDIEFKMAQSYAKVGELAIAKKYYLACADKKPQKIEYIAKINEIEKLINNNNSMLASKN